MVLFHTRFFERGLASAHSKKEHVSVVLLANTKVSGRFGGQWVRVPVMDKSKAWNPCSRLPLKPLKNRNAYLKTLGSTYSICQLTTETTGQMVIDYKFLEGEAVSFISLPSGPGMESVLHLAHCMLDKLRVFKKD